MELKEKADQVVGLLTTLKEDWVADHPESPDLAIYLHVWRGDRMVAMVQCPLDRDTALHAGSICASGFNASTMSLTFESYHSQLKQSPVTGKPWLRGEMQYLAERDSEAQDKGWVSECLTTLIHERGGAYAMSSQPFRIRDGKVDWLAQSEVHVVDSESENHADGTMFQYLQRAMSAPTIMDLIGQKSETGDLTTTMMLNLVPDDEVRYFHSDMAVRRVLMEKDLAITVLLLAEPGSKRAQMIHDRAQD